jgi:hypothetical protein
MVDIDLSCLLGEGISAQAQNKQEFHVMTVKAP